MRIPVAVALVAFACSTPAFATGGFHCRPVSGAGPVLNLAFGHTMSPRPLSATLQEGNRTLSTQGGSDRLAAGQSWVDGQHLWLDLLDPHATRFEGKLRATFRPKLRGRPAIGTFVRGGKTYRMRCTET